jgi:hypothetical protein
MADTRARSTRPTPEHEPGENVARAKRTQRADARRRYRNEQAMTAADVDIDEGEPPITSPSAATPRSGTSSSQGRGLGYAFREAFRPADVRSDLRALPMLLRHRAFWVPILLTIAAVALFVIVRPEGRNDILSVITIFLYQYFIVTPAIGGVFIAGFMAPRASYLLGILVGLFSAACYSFLVLGGFIGVAPTGNTASLARDVVIAAFIMSPLVGALFASTAAWYRRFLNLSNPNRGRSSSSSGSSGSRPDGRTRSSGANQKATAKR